MTDALVLSPADLPARPEDLAEVFDAFARCVAALESGRIGYGSERGRPLLAHPERPELAFHPTVLLRDGFALLPVAPPGWPGRMTRALVADFLRAECALHPRPPGWGARGQVLSVESDGVFTGLLPVKTPLVDPLREAAAWDDAATLPVQPRFAEPWGTLLNPWEHVDAFLATRQVAGAWIGRRKSAVRCPYGRWWWELRGLRDAGDPERYRGMWREPEVVTAYLGWPAYLFDAAGEIRPCAHCGRATAAGRRYCGAPECDRGRANARQRRSRAQLGPNERDGQ